MGEMMTIEPNGCTCYDETTRKCPVHRQPDPKANDKPAVWDLVIADMHKRDSVGHTRYGVRLQPQNGRDGLRDAYEEALDLCAYLRQVIAERDGA